jgi:hypothetical protein
MLSLPSNPCSVMEVCQSQKVHFFSLVKWSTIAVAVGVTLEGFELLYDLVAWIKRWRKKKRESAQLKELSKFAPLNKAFIKPKAPGFDHPRWVKVIGRLGLILVVLGVVGESRYGAKLEDVQNDIHTSDMARLTEAQRLAGDAAVSAKTAHEEADAVKKEADELERDILAQGPRWKALNHGRTEFMVALRPFPSQRLTVVVCGQDDSERFLFEQQLMGLVHKSGWAAPEYRRWQGCSLSLTGGNEIFVVSSVNLQQHAVSYSCHNTHDIARQGPSAAADALCDALNKLKISTMTWTLAPANQTDFPMESPPVNRLSVAVWARGFFGSGTQDSPAELAVQQPAKIFILVGPR